jgi:hypothetical protein
MSEKLYTEDEMLFQVKRGKAEILEEMGMARCIKFNVAQMRNIADAKEDDDKILYQFLASTGLHITHIVPSSDVLHTNVVDAIGEYIRLRTGIKDVANAIPAELAKNILKIDKEVHQFIGGFLLGNMDESTD